MLNVQVTPGEKVSNNSYISGKVRQIEICLLLEQEQKIKDAFKISTIPLQQVNNYKDIEDTVVESFTKHLQLLHKQLLDINQNDIAYLQVAQRKISLGSTIDLSRIDIEDGCLSCQMCLKGQNERSLAALSYDTLIPKTYLEKYLSLILAHRQVIFYGPSGTGKSYLARRIASLITHRMNNNKIPTLIYKNMSDTQWKELLLTIRSEKRSDPYVVLIDGFSAGFIKSERDIMDVITASESVHPQPYIICTLTQSPNYDIPTPWQNNFKWIWLPNHEEPVDGILERFLRRKFTQHGKIDTQQEGFRIADWLSSTWRHVNGVLERFNSTECTIGPTMFYTCPTDISSTEEWFIDLWNYSITPYILHAIKCGIKLYGQRHDWLDPLEWVLKTYPWSNRITEESNRKSKLRRIRPEDVGYQTAINTQQQIDSEAEKERLLDFLRQLELLMHDGGLGELPSFERATHFESSI